MPNVRNVAKLGLLLAVAGFASTLAGYASGGEWEYLDNRDYRDYRKPPRHSSPILVAPPGYEPSGARPPERGEPVFVPPGYERQPERGYDRGYDRGYGRGPLTIRVTGASYGADYACDASYALRNACDGRRSCAVNVSNHLCGDPRPGVHKELIVDYNCEGYGGGSRRTGAPEGRDIYLTCD